MRDYSYLSNLKRELSKEEVEHLMQYRASLDLHHNDEKPVHTHGKNGKYIEFDDIKHLINGYGRAIYFES